MAIYTSSESFTKLSSNVTQLCLPDTPYTLRVLSPTLISRQLCTRHHVVFELPLFPNIMRGDCSQWLFILPLSLLLSFPQMSCSFACLTLQQVAHV